MSVCVCVCVTSRVCAYVCMCRYFVCSIVCLCDFIRLFICVHESIVVRGRLNTSVCSICATGSARV